VSFYRLQVLCIRVVVVDCRYIICMYKIYSGYISYIVVYHFSENGCETSWIPNHSVARIVLLREGEGRGWEFIRRWCVYIYIIYQNKRYDHDRHFGRVPTATDQPIVSSDNMEISFPLRLPPTSGRPSPPRAILGPPTTYRPTDRQWRCPGLLQHRFILLLYVYCTCIRTYVRIYYIPEKNSHTQVRDFLCFPCPKTTTVVFFFVLNVIAITHGIY
jgi:hypothetical protein